MSYAAVLFCLCTLAAHSFGQARTGTIGGRVTDPDGKAVPLALVQATNSATGALYKTTSAADGSFTLARLPVGTYDITIPPIGFTFPQYQQKGVSVQPAHTVRVEIHQLWGGNLGTPETTSPIFSAPLRLPAVRRVHAMAIRISQESGSETGRIGIALRCCLGPKP